MEISMQNMDADKIAVQELTKDEIIAIYSTHSVRHFPADERKPVSSIDRMASEGIYVGYGLYSSRQPDTDNSEEQPPSPLHRRQLLGYAFFTALPERQICLLDYFAVMEDFRSHGIGSIFLQHMKASPSPYKGFLIESEDPDYAKGEAELSVRRKRLAFYERNGAVATGIKASVFGVPYCLLYFPLEDGGFPDTETLCSHFSNIYQRMVSPYHYETNVHIFPPLG